MNKFKGFLICTDCDGTLTNSDGKVSKANADAIKYFQDEGGLFTLATGRFPHYAKTFESQIHVNAPIVSLNGALLYDIKQDKVIRTWTMKREDCAEVLKYIEKDWHNVWDCWISGNMYESVGYKPSEHRAGDGSLEEFISRLPAVLYKNLFFQSADITKELQAQLKKRFGDKFRFDLSWPEGVEMQSIESGKGIAIKYMKEHLGQDIHITIGVGDYENDLSMMEYADIGYAVENSIDALKRAADRITVSNNEDALAKIIYEL